MRCKTSRKHNSLKVNLVMWGIREQLRTVLFSEKKFTISFVATYSMASSKPSLDIL